jgi:hypothetical protein
VRLETATFDENNTAFGNASIALGNNAIPDGPTKKTYACA